MRNPKYKAVLHSDHLNKYFVSDALTIDSGLACLFGFENQLSHAFNDLVLCSEKFVREIGEAWWEQDWVHIGNIEYTGLKDKNGVEIYDGYVLKTERSAFKEDDFKSGAVEFHNGKFMRKVNGCFHDIFAFHSEVIGNIYENPELLESTNELISPK